MKLFLLLLAVAFAAATHLGDVDPNALKDTEICYSGRACSFSAVMSVDQKEKAETAHEHSKKEEEKMKLNMGFIVESHCSTNDTNFYKLVMTEYAREGFPEPQGEAAVKKNPCYFKQRKSDGSITEIIFGKDDAKSTRSIKLGIIRNLSKKVHPEALHAARSQTPEPISYVFEGVDAGGRFKATHHLKREGKNVLLLETKSYADELSERNSETKGTEIKGQKMDIKNEATSKSTIGEDGRIHDMKEDAEVDIGDAGKPKVEAVYPSPSTGKMTFGNQFDIKRVSTRPISVKSCAAHEDEHVFSFIQTALRGAVTRDLHTPFSREELLEDLTTEELDEMTSTAIGLLRQGDFTVNQMVPNLVPENIGKIASTARRLYEEYKIPRAAMKSLLGCMSAVRSDDSYKELLGVLYARSAHFDLRQQALVSLLHTPDEPIPPAYLIDMVENLSNDQTDSFSNDVRMLLGALYERHPEVSRAMNFLQTSVTHLSHLHPNDPVTALNAMVLIGSIRNMGERGVTGISQISRFVHSKIYSVRSAAREAASVLMPLRRKIIENSKISKIEIPREDSEWLRKQTLNTLDLGGDEVVGDQDPKETKGGKLASLTIPLTGNKMFGINVVMSSGAEWDSNQAVAMGNVEMEIKILFFSMKVMNLGADYLLKKGINLSLTNEATPTEPGQFSFMFTVIGKTVLSDKSPSLPQDMTVGGECPKNLKQAVGAKWRPPRTWYLPLFMFKTIFFIGVPVTLTVRVGGELGYNLYGGINADCKWEQTVGNNGVVGGFGPTAAVDVVIDASLNLAIMKAGIEGTLLILKGTIPIYGIANTQSACGLIDLELEALSGKIIGYVDIIFPKKARLATLPIIKWTGPKKTINVMNDCKSVGFNAFPPLIKEKDEIAEKGAMETEAQAQKEEALRKERENDAAQKESEAEEETNSEANETGPTGEEELNKMRRSFERDWGFPVDPKYGTEKSGWPFENSDENSEKNSGKINAKPKHRETPEEKIQRLAKTAARAAKFEKENAPKYESARKLAKQLKQGRKLTLDPSELGPFGSSRIVPGLATQEAAARAVDSFANEVLRQATGGAAGTNADNNDNSDDEVVTPFNQNFKTQKAVRKSGKKSNSDDKVANPSNFKTKKAGTNANDNNSDEVATPLSRNFKTKNAGPNAGNNNNNNSDEKVGTQFNRNFKTKKAGRAARKSGKKSNSDDNMEVPPEFRVVVPDHDSQHWATDTDPA